MKIFEVTKKEVLAVINDLDDARDAAVLDRVYNSIKHDEIISWVTDLKSTVLSHLDKNQQSVFEDILFRHGIDSSYASLKEYVQLLKTDRFGNERFKQLSGGTLMDIVGPKMANNSVFKNTLPYIVTNAKQGPSGYGKGELFFMIYGDNAQKLPSSAHADVDLGGWKIEIKGTGAGLHPGANEEGQNVNIVDKLNADLQRQAKQYGFVLPNEGGVVNPVSGWFPSFFQQLLQTDKKKALEVFTKYLSDLYRMPTKESAQMAKAVLPKLGTAEAGNAWGSFIINNSRKNSEWESICALDTVAGTYQYINIVDGNNLPKDLGLMPTLKKTKSTYAYPDGWIGIKIIKNLAANTDAIDRYKKEIASVADDWNKSIAGQQNSLPVKVLTRVAGQIQDLQTRIDAQNPKSKLASTAFDKILGNIRKQTELVKQGKLMVSPKQTAAAKPAAKSPVKRAAKQASPAAKQSTKLTGMGSAAKRKQVLDAELRDKNSRIAQFISKTKATSRSVWIDKINDMLKAGNSLNQIAARLNKSDPTRSI
jgi:hypothetical protein